MPTDRPFKGVTPETTYATSEGNIYCNVEVANFYQALADLKKLTEKEKGTAIHAAFALLEKAVRSVSIDPWK